MEPIIQLSRAQALELLHMLTRVEKDHGIYSLRVHVDGEHAKFKVNEYTWTPPMGELEPSR
jgi:hypothetical protein